MPKKPPELTNWPVYSLKVGLASSLALVTTTALQVHDPISATFVAVVCTSPTVVTGLKRSLQQVVGSLVGGAIASLLLILGLEGPVALGLAVGLSVLLSGLANLREAHIVSAFTALFVVILGTSSVLTHFETRVVAVLIGAAAAFPVNYLLSALLYRSLFRRRVRVARQWAIAALRHEVAFDEALATVNALGVDLHDASRETLVRSRDLAHVLAHHRMEVERLQRILHFGKDLWLRSPEPSRPALHAAAETLAGHSDPGQDDSPLGRELALWAEQAHAASPSVASSAGPAEGTRA